MGDSILRSPRSTAPPATVRARSQAVYFNVRVAEALKDARDPVERACIVPELMKEVTEHLGPYKDVMQILVDEIVNVSFSEDEFTSSGENSAKIHRMPYFALLDRVTRDRRAVDQALRGENDELRKKVVQLGVSSSAMSETIRGQKTEINSITEELENTKVDYADAAARLRRAEDDRDYAKAAAARQVQELEHQQAHKEGIIRSQKAELEAATEYRDQYSTIQDAFSVLSHHGHRSESISGPDYAPEDIDRRDMDHLEKLEDQLYSLKNLLLTDFELTYDDCIESKSTAKLGDLRDSLVADVAAVDVELQSISRHRAIIASRLQRGYHHGYDPTPAENSEVERIRLQRLLNPSIELEEEEEEKEPEMVWPPPLPVVKSRHAVILALSSDGGHSFKTHRATSVCNGCGDRTTMCPHRAWDEIVVPTNLNVTHVKVYRPRLVVPPTPRVAEVKLTADEEKTELAKSLKKTPCVHDYDLVHVVDRGERGAFYMGLIWADFFHRGGTIPSHSRPLSVTQVNRMVREAYVEMDKTHLTSGNDTLPIHDDGVSSLLLDVLYKFMVDKYGNEDLAMSVAHDMLIVVHKVRNAHVELGFFHRVMATELNNCAWRYGRFLENYLDLSSTRLNTRLDLEVFARALYPVQFKGDGKEEHVLFIEKILQYLWRWETESGQSQGLNRSKSMSRSASRRFELMNTTSHHDAGGSVMSVLSQEGDDDPAQDAVSEEDSHEVAEQEAIALARLNVPSLLRYIRRACVLKSEIRYSRMKRELKKRDVFFRGFLSLEEFWESLHTQLLPTIQRESVEYYFATARREGDSDNAGIDELAWVASYLELLQVLVPPKTGKRVRIE